MSSTVVVLAWVSASFQYVTVKSQDYSLPGTEVLASCGSVYPEWDTGGELESRKEYEIAVQILANPVEPNRRGCHAYSA